ncbi:hypothetical protein AnigIFM63604_007634, partial [Aspergillus niger]
SSKQPDFWSPNNTTTAGTTSLNSPTLMHEANILGPMHNASATKPMNPAKLRLASLKNVGVNGRFTVGNAAPLVSRLLSKLT